MKYVLLGAAGHITRQLAVQLLSANHEVKIVGRSTESLKELAAQGASIAVGSVEDVAFLAETFAGADAVYTMVPPKWDAANWQAWIAQTGAGYADAIQQAGVKKVVNLSSVGAHLPQGCGPVSGLYFVEKALNEKSGADVLNLRPSYFYYNLFANIGLIKHMGIMGSNFGGAGIVLPIVDTADIAASAFDALHSLNFSGTTIQYIASDEVTTDQIAEAVGQAIGQPELKWVVFSNEQALGGMLQNGLSQEVANNYTELGGAIQNGLMMEDYLKNKPALSKVKLADFAKAFAAAYKAS